MGKEGGWNQRGPISGQGSYITHTHRCRKHAPWGVPTSSERRKESQVAHKWDMWLHKPCRMGGPHRFRVVARIGGGTQVGKVATYPLPPGGSPPLHSAGQIHRWPTGGQGGYITPSARGIPTPWERGA